MLTIADRLVDAKNYAEDYPTGPDAHTVTERGWYARRHVPFASFASTQDRSHIVSVGADVFDPRHQFLIDADDPEHFPRYSFYSPNTRNDGHDCGLEVASDWLYKFLTRFATTSAAESTLVVVTFDESADREETNRIYTVFLGPMLDPGVKVSSQALNHYNVLRTIEDNFGVAPLADGDGGALGIDGIWKLRAILPTTKALTRPEDSTAATER